MIELTKPTKDGRYMLTTEHGVLYFCINYRGNMVIMEGESNRQELAITVNEDKTDYIVKLY